MRARLYFAALAVLAFGFGSAALIYATADEDAGDPLGYEIIDGKAYRIEPGDSRAYRREIERFGGKAAVLFDRFGRWFDGLWHGKQLAFTVAWIAIFAALGILLFARYLTPDTSAGRQRTQ